MSISGKLLELTPEKDDLSSIFEMDLQYFPHPWSRDQWRDLDPRHYLLYAWQNNTFDAFALFHRVEGDETAHLLKILIVPELRGTALGQEFWALLINKLKLLEIKSVYLEVEKSNIRAVKFYQNRGFFALREIRAYYSDGATALTMNLTL